jgi:hypothetical protein
MQKPSRFRSFSRLNSASPIPAFGADLTETGNEGIAGLMPASCRLVCAPIGLQHHKAQRNCRLQRVRREA